MADYFYSLHMLFEMHRGKDYDRDMGYVRRCYILRPLANEENQ